MNELNNQKIKQLMFNKNITGLEMAKLLEIAPTTFYAKINNKSDFTAKEIGIMSYVLKTTPNFFYNICYDNSNKIDCHRCNVALF